MPIMYYFETPVNFLFAKFFNLLRDFNKIFVFYDQKCIPAINLVAKYAETKRIKVEIIRILWFT